MNARRYFSAPYTWAGHLTLRGQWRPYLGVFCFSPPAPRGLHVPYGGAEGQRSLPPHALKNNYMDMILKSSTFRCNAMRNCDKLLRKMVTWLDLSLERSVWLQYAKFLKIDEAGGRQLISYYFLRQTGWQGKRIYSQGKKVKLQLRVNCTIWWQIGWRSEYVVWGVRLGSSIVFPIRAAW